MWNKELWKYQFIVQNLIHQAIHRYHDIVWIPGQKIPNTELNDNDDSDNNDNDNNDKIDKMISLTQQQQQQQL